MFDGWSFESPKQQTWRGWFTLLRLSLRQVHTGHGQGGDAFAPPNKTEVYIGGSFDPDAPNINLQGLSNLALHPRDMRGDFRLFRQDRRINVGDGAVVQRHLPRRFFQEYFAGRGTPTRVGVGEKSANISFPQRAQDCVTNRVHQRIG